MADVVSSRLHPSLSHRREELRAEFAGARPFRHVVIEPFLTEEFCQRLQEQFPAFDEHHARNEFGEAGRKAVRPEMPRLGPAYEQLDELLRARAFLRLLSGISGIAELLYDPEYVGGGTHENLHGQDLDPHVDFNYHPTTLLHRRINLILFLNPEWEESWGGSLELHRDPTSPQDEIRSILPLANRCVIFETTERSWHGFPMIRLPADKKGLSRRSVAVYYYTKQRPAEETAPRHSTVYVQRPLPARFAPGYTLEETDLREIRDLLARRDTQIRYLYEREKQIEQGYSSVLERIVRSPSFRLARALTWPARQLAALLGKRRGQ